MIRIKVSHLFSVVMWIIATATLSVSVLAAANDPGWPRQKVTKAGTLVYYQPQIDSWRNYKQLDFRLAFSLTPAGGKPTLGIAVMQGKTDVDVGNRSALLHDLVFAKTIFPSLDATQAASMEVLVKTFLPRAASITISLDRLIASASNVSKRASAPVRHDPPQIFVTDSPALLLQLDGEPVFGNIEGTTLKFVVNTNFPVFTDSTDNTNYLFTGTQWLSSSSLNGEWTKAAALPSGMSKLRTEPKWSELASAISATKSTEPLPKVFYSTMPAEVLFFTGAPVYEPIAGTDLAMATNTDSDLIRHDPSKTFYYLSSGRWFRSTSLEGPWTYASGDLPHDFSSIPATGPAAHVLASVPGTDYAKDSVLLAQVPTTAVIDANAAAANASASYDGPPVFKPIDGTSLAYAANTVDKVIQADSVYYLCSQGVWFVALNPNGPWTTAMSVPESIYSIPPSSPVYNVTYVTQKELDADVEAGYSSGYVESSYSSGYMGSYVAESTDGDYVASGTGYYYEPYYYYPEYGYPIYYPYAWTYGLGGYWALRTYARSRGIYGPNGGVGVGAAYNPYTGTRSRAANTYGPYGRASVGKAYNPYTGAYGRGASVSRGNQGRAAAGAYNPRTGRGAVTAQASNAYSHWGASVVSNGKQVVQRGHYSNMRGTVAGARSSSGAKAVGVNSVYGSGAAIKTSNGDMYATRDGNLYRNTGAGWAEATNQDRGTRQQIPDRTLDNLNAEMQNRERGAAQAQNFRNASDLRDGGVFGGNYGSIGNMGGRGLGSNIGRSSGIGHGTGSGVGRMGGGRRR